MRSTKKTINIVIFMCLNQVDSFKRVHDLVKNSPGYQDSLSSLEQLLAFSGDEDATVHHYPRRRVVISGKSRGNSAEDGLEKLMSSLNNRRQCFDNLPRYYNVIVKTQ